MHRLLLTGTAAVAILITASSMPNCAVAIPLGGLADIPLALEQVNPIEKVALCFYFDGWKARASYAVSARNAVSALRIVANAVSALKIVASVVNVLRIVVIRRSRGCSRIGIA